MDENAELEKLRERLKAMQKEYAPLSPANSLLGNAVAQVTLSIQYREKQARKGQK